LKGGQQKEHRDKPVTVFRVACPDTENACLLVGRDPDTGKKRR
jgi:hypothetical protein